MRACLWDKKMLLAAIIRNDHCVLKEGESWTISMFYLAKVNEHFLLVIYSQQHLAEEY